MIQQLKNIHGKVFFTIEYNEEEKWLYANWIGFVSVENVIRGAEAGLEAIKQYNCHFLLNDNREVLGPWEKANDWLETTWMPQAEAAGLNYLALVLAPGIAAALSAQDMFSRQNGFFEMKLFGDIDKAKTWLREKRDTYNLPATPAS